MIRMLPLVGFVEGFVFGDWVSFGIASIFGTKRRHYNNIIYYSDDTLVKDEIAISYACSSSDLLLLATRGR